VLAWDPLDELGIFTTTEHGYELVEAVLSAESTGALGSADPADTIAQNECRS
jgi:hypothetical protein